MRLKNISKIHQPGRGRTRIETRSGQDLAVSFSLCWSSWHCCSGILWEFLPLYYRKCFSSHTQSGSLLLERAEYKHSIMSQLWTIHVTWILQSNRLLLRVNRWFLISKWPWLLGVGLQSGSSVCYSSVRPWCGLAGPSRSFEGVETMMEFPAGPFRHWSIRSLTSLQRSLHGFGCVADVLSPRASFF